MNHLSKIENAIFDLDGTLLNTLQDLTDSVNYVVSQYGVSAYSTEQVRNMVGNGIRKLMERAMPGGNAHEHFEEAFSDFKIYYQANCMNHTKPYEGIQELITELQKKNIKIGIVSNKNHEALVKLCDYFFSDHVDVVIGQQEGIPKKPAPDSVLTAMSQMQARKDNTIYIGDSEVDAQTAANAKLACILVTWGFRDALQLAQCHANVMIDQPKDLLNYI